jgi:hypothetical protein
MACACCAAATSHDRHFNHFPPTLPTGVPKLSNYLIEAFQRSAGEAVEDRWLWLEAAHVTGQSVLKLHWQSHVWMLQARPAKCKIATEIGGQLFRLALVPFGASATKIAILATLAAATSTPSIPWSSQTQWLSVIREAWNSVGTREAA